MEIECNASKYGNLNVKDFAAKLVTNFLCVLWKLTIHRDNAKSIKS